MADNTAKIRDIYPPFWEVAENEKIDPTDPYNAIAFIPNLGVVTTREITPLGFIPINDVIITLSTTPVEINPKVTPLPPSRSLSLTYTFTFRIVLLSQ